jgi:hypothetical protein
MRIAILLLFTFFFFNLQAQKKNPFISLKFDNVRMFDFEGGKGNGILYIIDENGKLATTVTKQVVLTKEKIVTLNSKLGDKKSYGDATAACFDPHLGFVYYLKNKIVAHITVCLDCNRLYSSIDIPAQKQGKVGKGKDAYYIRDGLSKSFRQFLNQLLVVNNFSHQIKKN